MTFLQSKSTSPDLAEVDAGRRRVLTGIVAVSSAFAGVCLDRYSRGRQKPVESPSPGTEGGGQINCFGLPNGQTLPLVMFQGQTPEIPTGAAGDWALLNAVLVENAYKAAVMLGPGHIRADSKEMLPSGTVLIGDPGTTIVQTLPNDGEPMTAAFRAINGGVFSSTNLATAAHRGDKQIDTTTPLQVGDLIQIQNDGPDNSPGLRMSTHNIVAVNGTVATLDRPLPRSHTLNDPIYVLISVPEDIYIDGQGMRLTGTGVRFLELVEARRCHIKNLRVDASQGIPGDLLFSFDCASHDCSFENITIQGDGSSLVGVALESNDGSVVRNVTVNGCVNGVTLFDCADCTVDSVKAHNCEIGLLLTTDSGIRNQNTKGCVNCTATGFSGEGGNQGILVNGGTENCAFLSPVCLNGFRGIVLGGDGTRNSNNVITAGTTRNNSQVGLWIKTGAPNTSVRTLDFGGNGGVGIEIDDDATLSELTSLDGNSQFLLIATAGTSTITGLKAVNDAPTPINTITFYPASKVSLRNGNISIGRFCNGINALGKLTLETVKVAPLHPEVPTVGLVVGGKTTRLGVDCDFDECLTATLVRPGAYLNVGEVALTAGDSGDIPWPDLKGTDLVSAVHSAVRPNQGTLSIVQKPGIGFRITSSDPADAGPIAWRINASASP